VWPQITPRDYPYLAKLYLVDLRALSVINPVSLETLIYDMDPDNLGEQYSNSFEDPLFKPYEEIIKRVKNLHWRLHPLDAANLLDHASPFLTGLESLTLQHAVRDMEEVPLKLFNYNATGAPALPPFTSLDILMPHEKADFSADEIEIIRELVLAKRKIGLPLMELGLSKLPISTSDVEWFEREVPKFGKSSKQYANKFS